MAKVEERREKKSLPQIQLNTAMSMRRALLPYIGPDRGLKGPRLRRGSAPTPRKPWTQPAIYTHGHEGPGKVLPIAGHDYLGASWNVPSRSSGLRQLRRGRRQGDKVAMLNRLKASGMMPGGGGGGGRGLSGATVSAAANPAEVIRMPVVPKIADSGDSASEDEAIRATHTAAARKPLPSLWDMPAIPEPKKKSKWDIIRKEVVKDSFGDLLRNVVALARQKYAEELNAVSELFGSSSMRSEGGRSKFAIPMLSKYEFDKKNSLPAPSQRIP